MYSKVILIGMDGLDPRIVENLILKKRLPNFKALGLMGGFFRLRTSTPAQSPVAWTSIATGSNPGQHGIFDFIHRNPGNYKPQFSIFNKNTKNLLRKRELTFLPVIKQDTFWDIAAKNDIPAVVIRWPVTFPPKRNKVRLYAGLGVTDLKGDLGQYTVYTDKRMESDNADGEKIISVKRIGNRISTYINGPQVETFKDPYEARQKITIKIISGDQIDISTDAQKITAKVGGFSNWLKVRFKVGFTKTLAGIVRFYLKQATDNFELYMTPIQIDPLDPAYVISNPDKYVVELSEKIGPFYTQGIPEDTKALTEGFLTEEGFIRMCDDIIQEQEKILYYELDRFRDGILANVFFTTDRIQHIFSVTNDPNHPLYDMNYAKKYGHVIEEFYVKMDKIIGNILSAVDDRTALMVCSDHGFGGYRRSVHLNTWLKENGFLKLTTKNFPDAPDGGAMFQFVDWSKTYAYSLGLGSIYLNKKNREKNGEVSDHDALKVLNDLVSKLLKFKDIDSGQPVVSNAYRGIDIYQGEQMEFAPDLVVGFNDGYRASWQTALGGTPPCLMEDNLEKWTGDHIFDPALIPGILFTNFSIPHKKPSVTDIAPLILSSLGLTEIV